MLNKQNVYLLIEHAVGNDVWGTWNDEFAGAFDFTPPANEWVRGQKAFCFGVDFVDDASRSARIVLRDVVSD